MMGPAEKPTGATDTWSLLIFGVNVIACLVIPIFGFVTCDPFKYGKLFSTKRNLHSIDKTQLIWFDLSHLDTSGLASTFTLSSTLLMKGIPAVTGALGVSFSVG